jgi:hypothetical protein
MPDHPRNGGETAGLPIADTASVEYHNSVPYPGSTDAFLYTDTILSSIARTLRPEDSVVIDLHKDIFEVINVRWIRSPGATSEDSISTEYHAPEGIDKAVHPAAECLVQITLVQEGKSSSTFSVLTVPTGDSTSPVLAVDVDDPTATSETPPSPHTASEEYHISRITRTESPAVQMDTHVEEIVDASFPVDTAGPRTDMPLSERSLPNKDISEDSDIQTLPVAFAEVGRCPLCQHAIVTSKRRERVVCVGCRRWCTLAEWNEYASDDPATRVARDPQW